MRRSLLQDSRIQTMLSFVTDDPDSPGGAAVVSQGCQPLGRGQRTWCGALQGRQKARQRWSIPEVALVEFDVVLAQERDELFLEGCPPVVLRLTRKIPLH